MSFDIQINPREGLAIPANAGRQTVELDNGKRTHYFLATVKARATTAGAVLASIRNRGSILAMFDNCGLLDGDEKVKLPAQVLGFIADIFSPGGRTAKRLTSTAIAVTQLEEYFVVPFAHPISVDPGETAYVEKNIETRLRAYLDFNADATKIAVAGGGGTFVVDQITVTVTQIHDNGRSNKVPEMRPFLRLVEDKEIAGTVKDKLFKLDTNRRTRAYIIHQYTTGVGEVGDIITELRLKNGARQIIGDKYLAIGDLQRINERAYSGFSLGAGPGVGGAFAVIDLQEAGRLARIATPESDPNMELMLNAAVSASAGTSHVAVYALELEPVPGVTPPKPSWESRKAS
jgi:hypothetical protein